MCVLFLATTFSSASVRVQDLRSYHIDLAQAFDGKALLTAKLHHASVHLIHQLICQGPGAHFTEYWIERLIWYLKMHLKDRVKDNGEIIFANDHLVLKSAASCRCERPEHCLTVEELKCKGRVPVMEGPNYDQVSDGVLLLGRCVLAGPTDEEAQLVIALLPRLLKEDPLWYRGKGWPAAPFYILHSMLDDDTAAKRIQIDKFMQASTNSMDMLACAQDLQHYETDNKWALVSYAGPGLDPQLCVAKIEFFVRVRACRGNVPEFDATDWVDDDATDQVGKPLDVLDESGHRVIADPLKLAVCQLWLAEDCDSDVIGCTGTRGVSELLRVFNMGEEDRDTLPPDFGGGGNSRPQSDTRCYFGHYLVDLEEIQCKLMSGDTIEGKRRGGSQIFRRYFMSCTKMSGK